MISFVYLAKGVEDKNFIKVFGEVTDSIFAVVVVDKG